MPDTPPTSKGDKIAPKDQAETGRVKPIPSASWNVEAMEVSPGKAHAKHHERVAPGPIQKSTLDGSALNVDPEYRRLAREQYRSLSPSAREAVVDESNRLFRTRYPRFDRTERLDPKNSEHRPYVRAWLRIRNDLVFSATEAEWEAKAGANARAPSMASGAEAPVHLKFKIFDKTDPTVIKRELQQRLDAHGVDRATLAQNVLRDLSDEQLRSLSRTRSGHHVVLMLQSELVASKEQSAQKAADRISQTLTRASMPPAALTSLERSQGILREGHSGGQFHRYVKGEAAMRAGNEGTAALNIARRLTDAHIRVAAETIDGLKGLLLLRRHLATGSLDASGQKEAQEHLKRIADALVPHSAADQYGKSAYGIVERHGYGKGMERHLANQIGIHGDKGAIKTIANLSNADVRRTVTNTAGKKGMVKALERLAASSERTAPEQLVRVLDALQSLHDPNTIEKQIEAGKVPIFPVRHAFFYNAPPFAIVTEEGNIRILLSNRVRHYDEFKNEVKTLPPDVFLHGQDFKPDQILGFRLYDEGGPIIYRPAAYALELNTKSVRDATRKAEEMAWLACPGAGYVRGTAYVAEKAVDLTIKALIVANIGIRQYRGRLIEKFGEEGREVVELMDRITMYSHLFGTTAPVAAPLLRLRKVWNLLRARVRGVRDPGFKAARAHVDRFIRQADDAMASPRETRRARASDRTSDPVRKTTLSPDELARLDTVTQPPFIAEIPTRGARWEDLDPFFGRNPQEIAANRGALQRFGYTPHDTAAWMRGEVARAERLGLGHEAVRTRMIIEARITDHMLRQMDRIVKAQKKGATRWEPGRGSAGNLEYTPSTLLHQRAQTHYWRRLRNQVKESDLLDNSAVRKYLWDRSEQMANRYLRLVQSRFGRQAAGATP